MSNPMRTRIAAHLDAMGLKPSSQPIKDALVAQGLHKTYLYEFMSGKKDTVAPKSLSALAKALNISVGMLDGSEGQIAQPQIKIGGVCEQGAWRAPLQPSEVVTTFMPDPRADATMQLAFLVRGNHAAGLGIVEGSVVIIGLGILPRAGEIVLVERLRGDGMRELFLRKHDGNQTTTSSVEFEEKVSGIVLLSIKRF